MPSTRPTLSPAFRLAATLAAVMASLGSAHSDPAAVRGLEIARAVDRANSGYASEQSQLEMVLVNRHGDRTVRHLRSETIEVEGDGDRSRIEFLSPADVDGTRLLTWGHPAEDDDQWLFLPAINRVKRITSRGKTGSFMGSEFSYEDLQGQEVEDFEHRYLGDDEIDGRKVWRTERVPVDERSGYGRQVVFVDPEYLAALKVDYYDRKGELLKTATFGGYAQHGEWWRPAQVVMVNHQTGKESHLFWKERELGGELDHAIFEPSELDR